MKNTKLQNSSLRKRKGFTLIELIVVIAILAILAAIAIPTFLGQLQRARESTHDANVNVLKSAANVAIAELGEPADGEDVTWENGALAEGDARFVVANYINEWPTSPWDSDVTDYYTVTISDEGVIVVAPDEGVYE